MQRIQDKIDFLYFFSLSSGPGTNKTRVEHSYGRNGIGKMINCSIVIGIDHRILLDHLQRLRVEGRILQGFSFLKWVVLVNGTRG